MEENTCKVNTYLNTDSLLPPRKRLLAGLKRQNFEANFPSPSKGDTDTPFSNNPFITQLSNSNHSNEDIVESSRIAATEAAKIATTARAKAEEKAEKAAKAFSNARNALDLVTTFSEEAGKNGKCMKKNKMKKHANVEELYDEKNKGSTADGRTDEELARNLHRAINSSPRILKNSDTRNPKHKRVKVSGFFSERITSNNSGPNGVDGNGGIEGPVKSIDIVMVGLNSSTLDESDRLKKGQLKRGRIKQKKLPLSICSFRDETGFKEGGNGVGIDGYMVSPDERTSTSMWKCQSLKVRACVKPPKVMQL